LNRKMIIGLVVVSVLLGFAATALATEEDEVLFRFAILSDRTGGHVPGVYPRVIDAINAQKPDLVITVGDHIEGYGDDYERAHAEWDSVLAMLRTIEAPVHMTPGNHDIWDDESEAIYIDRTGRKPFYSFDYENTHFIILDNSRIESWKRIGIRQGSWLIGDLASSDADNIFVFFHKPLWDQTLHRGKDDNLHRMLVEHSVEAVFCGHYHAYFAAEYEGIDYTTIGSSGGGYDTEAPQPELRGLFYQFAMVDVTRDGYELTVHNVDTGETYPRDFVTLDLLDEIERIENELVEVTPLRVSDQTSVALDVGVEIENTTERTLDGEATWDVPESWSMEPVARSYSVPPDGSRELEFTAQRSDGIYPVPTVSLEYPLADGRALEVRKAANVVRTVGAPKLDKTPVLDGKADVGLLGSLRPVSELYQAYGYGPVEDRTEFFFAHDGDNLYLTAVCEDDTMDEMVTSATERDGTVYMDDCVGFFLQPDPEEMVVYQIYVNSDGVVFDQMITFDESMWYTVHPDWDGDFDAGASRMDDRWVAELAIPFASLSQTGEKAEDDAPRFLNLHGSGEKIAWGLNFRRKQHGSGAVDWQVPIDYNPETFGRLVFE